MARIRTTPITGTTGTLSAMPATGTGSKAWYFATDDNGGTMYRDLTNGAAYTKMSPGVTQRGGKLVASASAKANISITSTTLAAFPTNPADLTWTADGGSYRIVADIPQFSGVNGQHCVMGIVDNSGNQLSGTNIGYLTGDLVRSHHAEVVVTPTAGSATYHVYANVTTGTGTIFTPNTTWQTSYLAVVTSC